MDSKAKATETKPTPATEPAGLTLKDTPPPAQATPEVSTALPGIVDLVPEQESATGLKKFFVKLPDNPTVRLLATDPYDAIRIYKKAMGIVHTIHDYTINPAD